MRLKELQRGQVLIIYLSTLFIGGSSLALGMVATGKSIKDLEKAVQQHVSDAAKQNNALELLQQWSKEGKARRDDYKDQRKALISIIEKYDADQTDFKNRITELLEMDNQTAARLLDIQYQLRDNLTAQEWQKVFN